MAALLHEEYRWLYWVIEALGAASALALGLAAVGLFGLISYGVSQRTREFGVRLALGAHPRTITSGVVREALAVTLTGLALGLATSIPIAQILNDGILVSISWLDPVPAAAVGVLLIVVAVLASLAPAMRVFRIDPVWALRQE